MKNNGLKKPRSSQLKKENVKGVGLFEGIALKIVGHIDGERSLPRKTPSGDWISPHLDREIRSYDEFASRIWGRLQIENETAYVHLGELIDAIVDTQALLEDAKSDLERAYENTADTARRYGESRLTESQVSARRAHERMKRLASLKSRVSALQSKRTSELDELSSLRSTIFENNNSTRMVCNSVQNHLRQRMDVYWNAVLCKHPDSAGMPAIPCVEIASRAEDVYMELHKSLEQRAEQISRTFSGNKKEAA